MSKEVLNLDELNVNQLPELATFETTQKELVKSNPFVEIIDNKTYEKAKAHRTALLKGRTSLENQEKLIASKLSNFRKSVGEKTKKLIEITLPFEEKQQSEVKRWENIKEAEKAEKERL
jgi:4-alpha-glucanotransferase